MLSSCKKLNSSRIEEGMGARQEDFPSGGNEDVLSTTESAGQVCHTTGLYLDPSCYSLTVLLYI